MKYVIRTRDGKEYGPVDQEVLKQWAESGRVPPDCEIRNVMLKTWSGTDKFPFLTEAIGRHRGQLPLPDRQPAAKPAAEAEVFEPREAIYSLVQAGGFRFTPASPLLRLLAWLLDVLLLGTIGALIFLAIHLRLTLDPTANPTAEFRGGTLLWFFIVAVYYVIGFGLKAQTVGQWFWGLMVVRTGGEPVLAGRALLYFLLHLLLLPATGLCVLLPGRRSPQDLIAGMRVVRTTVRDRK